MDKHVVAMHEAGHVLVILSTPLREHIVEARIFNKGDEWLGETRLDERDRAKIDPNTVYEFAKNIAGPLAQIRFCEKSIPDQITQLLLSSSGLLEATRLAVEKKIELLSNWQYDLASWTSFCARYPAEFATNFFKVEAAIDKFFQRVKPASVLNELADRLAAKKNANGEELLAVSLSDFPELELPESL